MRLRAPGDSCEQHRIPMPIVTPIAAALVDDIFGGYPQLET